MYAFTCGVYNNYVYICEEVGSEEVWLVEGETPELHVCMSSPCLQPPRPPRRAVQAKVLRATCVSVWLTHCA